MSCGPSVLGRYGATYNDTAVVASLLRAQTIDINAVNRFGMTALMVALQAGATAAAREIAMQVCSVRPNDILI